MTANATILTARLNEEIQHQAVLSTLVDSEIEIAPDTSTVTPACRVYKRRWVVLAIYFLYATYSSFSVYQYAIVANVIMRYYNVSSYAVDWTTMIYSLSMPFMIPALVILDKKGLRTTILIGTLGCAIGSCIKMASIAHDRFAVALVGQALVGISDVFFISVPPRLAAVWFGSEQVSLACSLAASGSQFGLAMGFLLTPIIIRNHSNIEDIGRDLSMLSYGMASFSLLLFLMVIVFFKDAPPVPPSVAQHLQQETAKDGFCKQIKRLLVNRGYLLLIVSNGICSGTKSSVMTLLNQLILKYFENGEQFAGRVGLVITVGSFVGCLVGGVVLDKTHKYKVTTLAMNIFGLVGMLGFTFVLASDSQLLVYLTALLMGACVGGFMPVAFELAMELTYPEPEGTSAGILLCVVQATSLFFILIYSHLVPGIGDVWANLALCGALLVGTVLTALIPPDMRRQAATKSKTISYVQTQNIS